MEEKQIPIWENYRSDFKTLGRTTNITKNYKDSPTKTSTEKDKEKIKNPSLNFLKDQRPFSTKSLPVPKNNY